MTSAVAQTGRSRMKVLTQVTGVAAGILLVAYVVMLPTLREKAKENRNQYKKERVNFYIYPF